MQPETEKGLKADSIAEEASNENIDVFPETLESVEGQLNHRRLSSRQIQLLAIAGTVGAALFVAIGSSLRAAGPLGLLLGFIFWTSVIFCVAKCQAEASVHHSATDQSI